MIIIFLFFNTIFFSSFYSTSSIYANDIILKNSNYGFTENRGQLKSDALFYYFGKNSSILIFKDRIIFDFHRIGSPKKEYIPNKFAKNGNLESRGYLTKREGMVLSMEFLDFNKNFILETLDETNKINYFKNGKEITGLKKFGKLKLINLYDRIDLLLGFDQGQFRFDLILNENANAEKIKLKINGGEKIRKILGDDFNNNSKIEILSQFGKVYFGEITSFYLSDEYPYKNFYKGENTGTEYQLNGNILSFKVGNYDKTRKFVIDPTVYSTFFGGLDVDEITDMVKDKNEDIIITGWTRSENFRTTPGAYNTLFYSETDCFVSKFKLIGIDKKLIFSTIIGGNADDYSKSISLDSEDNIYIGGETESFDYPVKNSPYSSYSGLKDGFISKFSNDGVKLLYSSYFGGTKQDRINSIVAGSSGEIYITGGTYSNDIPITIIYNNNNPNNKGLEEAFVTKLYSNGSIQYSYLLPSLGFEYGSVISLNEKVGMLVVGGQTNSSDLISFPKSGDNKVIDYVYNGGQDIFLAVFTPGLGTFNFCTFLGGSGDDFIKDILIDDDGNIYIAGETSTKNASVNPTVTSTDFRITNTAYQKKNNGGFDAFLMAINKNGTKLLGSTFLGGKNNDSFLAMDFNNGKKSIFLTGYTQSPDFPKVSADDNEKYLAKKDVIISNLSLDCSKLLYSTIIGVSGDDVANSIIIDKFEGINIAGSTNSKDFPISDPLESNYLGGSSDGFIYRRIQKNLKLIGNLNSFEYCQNENVYLSWLVDGFEKYHPFFVDVSTDNGKSWNPIVSNYERYEFIWKIPSNFPAGNLNKIRVYSPSGIVAISEGNFTVLSSPRVNKIELSTNDNVFCEGDSFEIRTEVEGEQLKFSWEKDGKPIAGQNKQNLKVNVLNQSDEGVYTLNVIGKCKPDVRSSPIKIAIKPKTKIISDLEDKQAKLNENVEFKIQAKGLKLSYEWQRNGIKIINQTDSVLRLNNVNKNFEGIYRCIVTGECGSDTSKNVYLQIDTATSSVFDLPHYPYKLTIKSVYSKSFDEALEFQSEIEDVTDISIFDINGKQISKFNDYNLKIGNNRILLNFDEFYVGAFLITIKSSIFTKNNVILITD